MSRLWFIIALAGAGVGVVGAQTILLDSFNPGATTGAVLSGTSWIGNVTQNSTSITVGGTAKNDSGWGASHLTIDASATTYLRITAQRTAGNEAPVFAIQFEDGSVGTTVFTVSASAFSLDAFTTVQVPIAWSGEINPAQITGWQIGGGPPPPGQVPMRMTLENLALGSGLLPLSTGGSLSAVGTQTYATAQSLTAATTVRSVSGSAVSFGSTIDGAQALTIATDGTTSFGGAVGEGTPLNALTTDAGGTTAINGGKVITTGAQTYNDTVSLGANTLIKSTGGMIGFNAALVGNGHSLTIENSSPSSFTGASGLSSLIKNGGGVLTLVGQSTYTGPTVVNGGTLALGRSGALASASPLTLNGATFATAGFSQTLGALTLSAGSTINFGNGTSALVFAASSGQVWTGSLSILNYTTAVDSLRVGTSSNGVTAAQLALIGFSGIAAQIDLNGFVTPSAIPEPSAYAALVGACALLIATWKRRRRRDR